MQWGGLEKKKKKNNFQVKIEFMGIFFGIKW